VLENQLTRPQQIKTGLESLGFKPEVHELSWFQDDYGLKAGEDEDGVDDDDDDADDDGEGSEDEDVDEDDEDC